MTAPDPGFGVYIHWPFCLAQSVPIATSTAMSARRSTRRAGAARCWLSSITTRPRRRAAPSPRLLRRRHTLAHGARDGGGADREASKRIVGGRRRTWKSRSRPIPEPGRGGALRRRCARPASTGFRSACKRSMTMRCVSLGASTIAMKRSRRSSARSRHFDTLFFRSDLRTARPERRRLARRARRSARLGRRPSLGLSAHHRAGHRVPHAGSARQARRARRRDGGRALRDDRRAARRGRHAGLRNLESRERRARNAGTI